MWNINIKKLFNFKPKPIVADVPANPSRRKFGKQLLFATGAVVTGQSLIGCRDKSEEIEPKNIPVYFLNRGAARQDVMEPQIEAILAAGDNVWLTMTGGGSMDFSQSGYRWIYCACFVVFHRSDVYF